MITREDFGTHEGHAVSLYTLANAAGWKAKITDWGGILTEMHVPDRDGNLADVTLGFDSLAPYQARHPFFGALVGRYANRIGGARFSLDGRDYELAANEPPNHLHGGVSGFDKRVWESEPADDTAAGPSLALALVSPDGDEGYPGTLGVRAVYTLAADALVLDLTAETDAPTVLNITHHAYWNLAGHGAADILGHTLRIDADAITPTGPGDIPTGDVAPVAGTPYDFRDPKPIGRDTAALAPAAGYDMNFVVSGAPGVLRPVAEAHDPGSGRAMELSTTEPGLQFYSGFKIGDGMEGKAGATYGPCSGFCLEPQKYPDSPNRPGFPSADLRPGETYTHRIAWRFFVRD